MTITFGTNVRVTSWIEVAACSIEIINPTISETNNTGAEINSIVYIVSRIKLTTKSSVIFFP